MTKKSKKSTLTFRAAGVTFEGRQGYICHLMRNKEGAFCFLERDRNNKVDANAIRIVGHAADKFVNVGYVPAELAKQLAPIMDSNKKIWCKKFDITRGGKPLVYGVELTVTY